MTGTEITQVITTVCGMIITLGLAWIGYLKLRAGNEGVKSDVRDVHSLVNNQLDRQLDRNAQLTRTLTGAGVDVPPAPPAAAPASAERMARPDNHLP
jgi:hypothetical protein